MLMIVATLPVQEARTAEFEKVFAELTEKVLANEPGCKGYQLCQSTGNPTKYVVVESYVDQAAIDHHGKTAYFAEAFGKMGGMLSGAPTIEILKPVG